MAKKKAAKVDATSEQARTWAVRLEFDAEIHERLARAARAVQLSKSGFARQAVVTAIRAEEAKAKE